MEPLIISIVILLFLGVCIYAIIMPKYMVKRGRKVDARVVTCEEKYIEDPDTKEKGIFYEVTVDFYGLYGETIVKKFQSETAYGEGEVIRSRYLDKRGLFWPDADAEAKEGPDKGIWLVIGFLIGMLALILFVVFSRDENGNLPDWFTLGFGYFTSILFIGIGVWGIYKQILLKRKLPGMQVLLGVVADYTIDRGNRDEADSYFPIYEYEWMGEWKRFKGSTGGSSKKYRTIGRKVHILRDPATGKVLCKEDETGKSWFFAVFLLFGVVAFVCLLLGKFSSGSDEGSKDRHDIAQEHESGNDELTDAMSGTTPAWEMYYFYVEEGTEKCSYSIRIFDDCSGQVILFPTTTVDGKGINQNIYFEVTMSDMVKIGEWLETIDYENLDFALARDGEEVQISLNLYDSGNEEKYSGMDYPDNEIYGAAYELMKEIVPNKVWKEMREREEEYYR